MKKQSNLSRLLEYAGSYKIPVSYTHLVQIHKNKAGWLCVTARK